MASAADIEQMNKVRVSLGMAPLPVPGHDGPQFKDGSDSDDSGDDSEDDISTLEKRAAAAGKNWAKLEAEKREKEERQRRKDDAKKARDKAARFQKLEGKGLGDADDGEELDTRAWLMQQKKRQKKIEKARKLEEELAAREQQAEYTTKDLAGVKVAHEAAAFDDITGEQVLTLKDQEIGEDSEDDELENQDLRAKEKLEENLRLKKKRPDYDPTEQGEKQNVLSKYDEEIEGKQQKRFTLDGAGSTVEASRKAADENADTKGKGIKISLDILKDDAPTSDYVDPATIKVKKPKKSKKERKTRQKVADEDDVFPQAQNGVHGDAMEVDGEAASTSHASKKRVFDFDDDDDLQAKLAETRRQALKKRKKTDAAELARQLREEMPIDEPEEDGGLVIDETSEFVANLKKPEDEAEGRSKVKTPRPLAEASPDPDEDGDTTMGQQSYAEVDEAEERAERAKRETSTPVDKTTTGLDEEETMEGQGLGATLAMMRKRGLIENSDSCSVAEKEARRRKFLADKQHLIDEYDMKAREQREADRRNGRFDKISNRERDALARQQNEQREQFISRLLADKFNKEYKPDVKLQYHDEYGNEMNQKEAFKHLSHMFHGKGSGKQKTEKRLKKMEDDKKKQAKGILNIGDEAGFSNVGQAQGKRQKTAGVRLQ